LKKSRISIRVKYRGRDVTPTLSTKLRENWGAPFIITFVIMLMVAVGYLCYGLESIANDIAVYAYYSLIIGVVLQFVCYLKHGGK
jgi:hypothetical protein